MCGLRPIPASRTRVRPLYTGDIYVKDCWFSKEAPADGVTPVDDTWRTEAWCGYTVTRGGADSEATISYEHPADWSRFYRPVPLEEVLPRDGTVNNMLRIRFTSDAVTVGDVTLEDSVEQFQVGLWGDPDPTSDAQFLAVVVRPVQQLWLCQRVALERCHDDRRKGRGNGNHHAHLPGGARPHRPCGQL